MTGFSLKHNPCIKCSVSGYRLWFLTIHLTIVSPSQSPSLKTLHLKNFFFSFQPWVGLTLSIYLPNDNQFCDADFNPSQVNNSIMFYSYSMLQTYCWQGAHFRGLYGELQAQTHIASGDKVRWCDAAVIDRCSCVYSICQKLLLKHCTWKLEEKITLTETRAGDMKGRPVQIKGIPTAHNVSTSEDFNIQHQMQDTI